MKNIKTIIAAVTPLLLLSACGESADETVAYDDVGEARTDAGAAADYEGAAQPVPANPAVPATDTGADTDRVRIGPDGAEVEVGEGNTDVRVRTDEPSLEIETE